VATEFRRKKKTELKLHEAMELLRSELPRLREQYAVLSLGLFGSYVRGEQNAQSDFDVLVQFSKTPGMFKFLALERDLARILGVPVDLVHKDALKPAIGKRIMGEVVFV
jgi:hypothetical protein